MNTRFWIVHGVSTSWSQKSSCTCLSSPGEEGIQSQGPAASCSYATWRSSPMTGFHIWSCIHWKQNMKNRKLTVVWDDSIIKIPNVLYWDGLTVPEGESSFVHLYAHQEGIFRELDRCDEIQRCLCFKADLHTRSHEVHVHGDVTGDHQCSSETTSERKSS